MRVLITGCKGQLGIEVAKQLSNKQGFETFEKDIHNLDITNKAEVFDVINSSRPDVVINCAAYTNVDACESDELTAFRVNAAGAQNLSEETYKTGSCIVQISTDYVFDGVGKAPKKESDLINPLSVYGKSKALGEQLVRESNPRHFILRTAWLYGEGSNFVRTMLKLAKEKGEVQVVDDQFGCPTSTVDLARCITNLINTQSYGTYHATCEGECSWYEFAKKIFEIKRLNTCVKSISTQQLSRPAKRPKYSVLDNHMLRLMDLNTFRDWEDALEEYLRGENLA